MCQAKNVKVFLTKNLLPNEEVFKKMGFKFSSLAESKDMYEAELPEGWTVENMNENSMVIKDGAGKQRGRIDMKVLENTEYQVAASLCTRFFVAEAYCSCGCRKIVLYDRKDGYEKIQEFDVIPSGTDVETKKEMIKKAEEKVDTLYPCWRSPLNYWD